MFSSVLRLVDDDDENYPFKLIIFSITKYSFIGCYMLRLVPYILKCYVCIRFDNVCTVCNTNELNFNPYATRPQI